MSKIVCTSDVTVRNIQCMGGDHMVVAAARVSTSGEDAAQFIPGAFQNAADWQREKWNRQRAERTPSLPPNPTSLMVVEENRGLIRYLMRQRHGTPFEHSAMTFFVHAPICVWREWHRHRIGFSYNEESGRYKKLDPVFYVPPRDRPMIKVEDWKPGRPKFLTLDDAYAVDRELLNNWTPDAFYAIIIQDMKDGYVEEYERYERQLSRNLDPGLARDNLPVGIYSSCWVTCNPRSLMAFLSLRTHEPEAKHPSYPLYEIEVAARAAEQALREGWPETHRAFCDFGRVAP